MASFGRNSGRLDTDQLDALAHPIRLRIVAMYTKDAGRDLTADALTADLAREAPDLGKLKVAQVAYHVARLRDAHLLPGG